MKIKLISDSACDLTKELINECDLEIVSLYVNFKEKSYKDGLEINAEKMYDLIESSDELPKTAAVSPGDFVNVFTKYLDRGYYVLYIGIGSKISSTFNNAKIAKDIINSNNIYLLDSNNLSSSIGLLVLKANKYIKEGYQIEDVYEKVSSLVPRVRCQFAIDTLEYLYKGGRLNALSNLMGSILKIKPIIRVVDGQMAVGKKARGNIKMSLDIMIADTIKEKNEIDEDFLMITHSCANDSYEYIYAKIKNEIPIKNIYQTSAGCGISCHCGRGTIGILYILK